MQLNNLDQIAKALVIEGKGILAADESISTATKRLTAHNIESTPETRRAYREIFFTTPCIGECISGVILQDETIHQKSSQGIPMAEVLSRQGIIPGIKVDGGTKPLPNSPTEKMTEGYDGLRERLKAYRELGAQFAKWRAVITISNTLPSNACIKANAMALALYAALCQEQGIVPIVEPEVLMDGSHTLERCSEVTSVVLHAVFNALFNQGIHLEGMLLKPNMVLSGKECPTQASIEEVASATLCCLRRFVPSAVPGIVFLSGGQEDIKATQHLNAINTSTGPKPWKLSFSYGRALQEATLKIWGGKEENFKAGQEAFYHRAKCNSAATLGKYSDSEEIY